MKKLVLLTSILALAACGGGSGGHHGGAGTPGDITNPGENNPGNTPGQSGGNAGNDVLSATESNAKVTAIAFDNRTEVIDRAIAEGMTIDTENGDAMARMARVRAGALPNGIQYTDDLLNKALQFLKDHGLEDIQYARYNLDNINFSFIEPDEQEEIGARLITDKNGKIIAWKDTDGDRFERDGETNYFNGRLGKIKLQMYGKDVGLRFSDFGTAIPVDEKTSLTADFAGSLDERRAEAKIPETDIHFTGRAVGSVGYDGNDGTEEKEYLPLDGKVDLVLGKDKNTLTATFDNWYTIGIDTIWETKTAKLTDGDKIKNEEYRFANPDNNSVYSWAQYSGPDENTPTEVVGGIGIKDNNPGSHLNVSLSFGAKGQ